MKLSHLTVGTALALLATACDNDDPVVIEPDYQPIAQETPDSNGPVAGVYVLNEGNMGSNKCTIDFFDYSKAMYIRNIYPYRNPTAILELGDTGNDIKVYRNRLYAVINGSNKVEVMDAQTTIRLGQIDIDACRYIAFDGKYGYVSSFVGGLGDNGSIVRFDTETLQITGKVSAGLQPEEIVIADGYLYVANSGQFQAPDYDRNITVIRLSDFTVVDNIEVDVNMHHLKTDAQGNLWVSSRGNYADIPSNLYKLPRNNAGTFENPIAVNVPCSDFAVSGNKIYYYATVYDANWNPTQEYGIVDVATAKKESGSFITDGTAAGITSPYTIAVQPANGDIFITDAMNYTSSGQIRCYNSEGRLKWYATTGDIPGHIAFLMR